MNKIKFLFIGLLATNSFKKEAKNQKIRKTRFIYRKSVKYFYARDLLQKDQQVGYKDCNSESCSELSHLVPDSQFDYRFKLYWSIL